MDSTNEPGTASTIETTLVSTLTALAPALVAANPAVSSAAALATLALQFLQAAQQIQAAGLMTQAELASTFATIGQGVLATHTAWVALNTPATEVQHQPA